MRIKETNHKGKMKESKRSFSSGAEEGRESLFTTKIGSDFMLKGITITEITKESSQ